MMKRIVVLMVFCALSAGCSPNNWMARLFIFQAETAVDKAGHLKSQKVPFERRISYYAQACELFSKAYERNPDVFTLSRIEIATDSCWKANNESLEQLFKEFEEVYIKNHPQEYEHGDSGVAMMEG